MTNADQAPYADPEQLLPEGRTCRDCARFKTCEIENETPAASVACEWSPRRFSLEVAL